MLNIFVTGTGSNVGKTFISAGIAATMQSLGYSTCVYKPVQAGVPKKDGFAQSRDLVFVKNVDPYIKVHSTYLLKEQAPPAIAAENEKILIDKNFIKQDYELTSKDCDCMITEGTGGIMTPLAPDFLNSDMIKILDVPAVIIVKPEAGMINQALLTINHAVLKGIKVRGVIINNFFESVNDTELKSAPRLIEEYSDAKILGIVKSFKHPDRVSPSDLITTILNGIDIESVFGVNIAKLAVE
jgi:dethiobiotin synthetase